MSIHNWDGPWRSLNSGEVPLVGTNNFPEAEFESAASLSARLGLSFSNLHLLRRALTHRSFANENQDALEDNERLEFLGDAVLDFIAGAWVYSHCPEMAEGDLTRVRSALVRTDTLASFARQFDIGSALRLGRGELASGGQNRENLLCGAFEAIIGALYLDAGIETVEKFIHPLLEQAHDDVIFRFDIYDPKSTLQEWAQGNKMGTPRYVTVNSSGPDHAKTYIVEVQINGKSYGQGTGSSKQTAAQMAAQAALESQKLA